MGAILRRYRSSRLAECHAVEGWTMELLVGNIGSGKSTFARSMARQGALVVCHDDLVAMLHAERRYVPRLGNTYRRIEEEIVREAYNQGHRYVIVDRTNLTRESRGRWIEFGMGIGRAVVARVFPLESPEVHARRRFESDPRGQTYEEWLDVARRFDEQARRDPVGEDEGFKIIRHHEFEVGTFAT